MGLIDRIKQLFPADAKKAKITINDVANVSIFGLNRATAVRLKNDDNAPLLAYRSHELVFACINKIADVMNDAEVVVERFTSEEKWERIKGHPFVAMFSRPNPMQTGRDLRRLMVQSEQCFGCFYAYIERAPDGAPRSLMVLNPNRVKTEKDVNGDIKGYSYLLGNGGQRMLGVDEVLIRRRADIVDQLNGFAPLLTALASINSDLGFTDYVDAFFESDGTPSGLLKILNQNVNETKREALQAQWRLKYGRGGSNQKGVAVLDQNADFQKIGSNLDELASDSLSGRFESRICTVFGVPPNLVGAYVGLMHVTANATARSELRNFWDNKISGELAALREWLTWFVLPLFEPIEDIEAGRVRVSFDISQVAFLQDNVDAIHKRSRENFQAGGWTLNEFRQATGQLPDDAGDYYIQPRTVAPISPDLRAADAVEVEKVAANNADKADENLKPAVIGPRTQKKKYELDGMTLSREPRGVELLIDLKRIDTEYLTQAERVSHELVRLRDDLIHQFVSHIADNTEVDKIRLTPDPKYRKRLSKLIADAYAGGRRQVLGELASQRTHKADDPLLPFEVDKSVFEWLDELTDGLISRIIAEVSVRAVNEYYLLRLLTEFTVELLATRLLAQSTKYAEAASGETVQAAFSAGRRDELEEQADGIDHYEYSAIMDRNTCGECESADGMQAASMDDLPPAPNPDCEGGARCRCMIIGVVV